MLIFPFLDTHLSNLLADQSTRYKLVSAVQLFTFAHLLLLLEAVSSLPVFLLVLVHIDPSAYRPHFYLGNFALEPPVLVINCSVLV